MEWRVKKVDGKRKPRNARKGREKGSPLSQSSVSINRIKLEADQTSDSTSDMGGPLPGNQSAGSTLSLSPVSINQIKLEADQTSDSTSDMGVPLPGNQSAGSTLSLSPVSINQIKMEADQTSDSTSDMGGPLLDIQSVGSTLSLSPVSINQIKLMEVDQTSDSTSNMGCLLSGNQSAGSTLSISSVSVTQIKMEVDQTSYSTSDMGGPLSGNQSTGSTLSPISVTQIKMEVNQTSDWTPDKGSPLPGNQLVGSTLSLSPDSVTQFKMEGNQTSDWTLDMGSPLLCNQSMEVNQTSDWTPDMGSLLPGNKSASSTLSLSSDSITQIKIEVDQTSYLTPDMGSPLSGNQSSSSSNKVLRSSSTHSKRSISQQSVGNQQTQTSSQITFGDSMESGPISERKEGPFDIFRTANLCSVKLKQPLHVLNKERKKEVERAKNTIMPKYLRSGMVLLKNFINHIDQVKILNISRVLGIGPGGFYRPGYKDGPKLHLQMMCLGMDWDPGSRSYGGSRPFDGAVPPKIPYELRDLVNGALHAALNFLGQSAKSADEIPMMSPDICIVNFYSKSGKLGLHQDRDESSGSLEKGLPVVSFSIGDSAEFLYSDGRDVDKPDKVILESGDVLIFGGKARHIFHGVPNIIPNTAPKLLIDQTNLLPGRLNLTFRQY